MLNYKKSTKLSQLIGEYPGVIEYMIERYPSMKMLRNPLVVQNMASRITISKLLKKHGISFEEFLKDMQTAIENGKIGDGRELKAELESAENFKEKVKSLMKRLFEKDENAEEVRKEFKDLLKRVNPVVIAIAEAELTKEGYSIQDLMKACDVHLELFKDELMNARRRVPKSHPLWRFIKDHDAIILWVEEGLKISRELTKRDGYEDAKDLVKKLNEIMKYLKESENHDVRQENTLFPVLERYGVEEPPAIMWDEHSKMKERRKKIEDMLNKIPEVPYREFVNYLQGAFTYLVEVFVKHTQKEQEILYNVALDILSEKDWNDIKRESDRLGYFELPKEVLKDE